LREQKDVRVKCANCNFSGFVQIDKGDEDREARYKGCPRCGMFRLDVED